MPLARGTSDDTACESKVQHANIPSSSPSSILGVYRHHQLGVGCHCRGLSPSPPRQAAFRRDLNRWVAAQTLDQNAPWPSGAEANPTATAQGSDWNSAHIDWGDTVSFVYSRSVKPPMPAFKLARSTITCTTCRLCSLLPLASAAEASAAWAGAPRSKQASAQALPPQDGRQTRRTNDPCNIH